MQVPLKGGDERANQRSHYVVMDVTRGMKSILTPLREPGVPGVALLADMGEGDGDNRV